MVNKIKTFFVKLRKYLFINFTSGLDFILYCLSIPDTQFRNDLATKEKTVIYLGEYSWPRITRIAKYVKKDFGYRIILICFKGGLLPKLNPDGFDQVITFRNGWHLKRIVRRLNKAKLIHAYGPVNKYPAIGLKAARIPVVYDCQDVVGCYYGLEPEYNHIRKEVEYERINFTQSQGLVAQSAEPIVGRKIYKTPAGTKSIFFPIYCDAEAFIPKNKIEKLTDGLHIVYIGGVAGSHRDPERYGSIQFQWLIDTFSKLNIHFHIYPSPANMEADYIEYEYIAKSNAYFHFHPSVSQSELTKEISKYHFSIVPFFSGQNLQSNIKYKYATAFKLFNYIEAGLPVLVSEDMGFQSWIIKRYSCGLTIDKKDLLDLNTFLKQFDYTKLISDLIDNREKLSLQRQIPRMVQFYEQIGTGKSSGNQ
jgi:glycosyltransferase involved in cell wall biosynthesis